MHKHIIQNETFVFRVFEWTSSKRDLRCLLSLCSTNRTPRTLLASYVQCKWIEDHSNCVIFGNQLHEAFWGFAQECSASDLPRMLDLKVNEQLLVVDDKNVLILGGKEEIVLPKNRVYSKAVQSLYERISQYHVNHGFIVGPCVQGPKLRSFLTLLLDNSERELKSIIFPNLGSPDISSLSSTFCSDDNWCLLKDDKLLSILPALLSEQVNDQLAEMNIDLQGYKIKLMMSGWYLRNCMNYLTKTKEP